MKRFVILAVLALSGCAGQSSQVADVIAQINKVCGFQTDDIKALEALLAANNAQAAGVVTVANLVCAAVKPFAPKPDTISAMVLSPVTVTVQGVPITGHF